MTAFYTIFESLTQSYTHGRLPTPAWTDDVMKAEWFPTPEAAEERLAQLNDAGYGLLEIVRHTLISERLL